MEVLYRFKFENLNGISNSAAKSILVEKLKLTEKQSEEFLAGKLAFKPMPEAKTDKFISVLSSVGIHCKKIPFKDRRVDNNQPSNRIQEVELELAKANAKIAQLEDIIASLNKQLLSTDSGIDHTNPESEKNLTESNAEKSDVEDAEAKISALNNEKIKHPKSSYFLASVSFMLAFFGFFASWVVGVSFSIASLVLLPEFNDEKIKKGEAPLTIRQRASHYFGFLIGAVIFLGIFDVFLFSNEEKETAKNQSEQAILDDTGSQLKLNKDSEEYSYLIEAGYSDADIIDRLNEIRTERYTKFVVTPGCQTEWDDNQKEFKEVLSRTRYKTYDMKIKDLGKQRDKLIRDHGRGFYDNMPPTIKKVVDDIHNDIDEYLELQNLEFKKTDNLPSARRYSACALTKRFEKGLLYIDTYNKLVIRQ